MCILQPENIYILTILSKKWLSKKLVVIQKSGKLLYYIGWYLVSIVLDR